MSIKGYFFNAIEDGGEYDRTYNAEDVTSYLDKIVGNGVFPTPSTQLQVTAGTGIKVVVAPGQGWVDGHKMINTTALELSLTAADALLSRIDRVVFYADFTEREMGIKVVTGTTAESPTAPALVRTDAEYQMSLATVRINPGTSQISQSMITDTRPDSTVCGWVQGLVQSVDTSTLFTQWETAYTEFYAAMQQWMTEQQNLYETWFETLTSDLVVGAYLNSFEKSASLTASNGSVTLDMDGYTYENTDVFFVTINGLLVPPTGYTLDTSGESPVLTFTISASTSNPAVVYVKVLKTIIGPPPAGGSQTSQLLNISTSSTESTITGNAEEE